METSHALDTCLNDTHELEAFLHAFLAKLDAGKLKVGDDVTHQAKELGMELPPMLKDATITWEGTGESHRHEAAGRSQTLVFVRPGDPQAVGLTIKCVKIRKWTVCLECGWIWCRIVVTRRF